MLPPAVAVLCGTLGGLYFGGDGFGVSSSKGLLFSFLGPRRWLCVLAACTLLAAVCFFAGLWLLRRRPRHIHTRLRRQPHSHSPATQQHASGFAANLGGRFPCDDMPGTHTNLAAAITCLDSPNPRGCLGKSRVLFTGTTAIPVWQAALFLGFAGAFLCSILERPYRQAIGSQIAAAGPPCPCSACHLDGERVYLAYCVLRIIRFLCNAAGRHYERVECKLLAVFTDGRRPIPVTKMYWCI